MNTFQTPYRIAGAIVGWFALVIQLYLLIKNAGSFDLTVLGAIVRFLSFMTIWTNILVSLSYTLALAAPHSRWGRFFERPGVEGGLLVYIVFVGITYHLFLANLWNPTGLQWLADNLLHYLVPIMYLVYWLLFAKKELLQWKHSYQWLIYPAIYFVFALIQGAINNFYAYPFIDVSKLGYSGVFKNAFFMIVAYFVLGCMVIFIDRKIPWQKNKSSISKR